jgi:3',5'-cyclic AMP phosphodiesterase CpdA
MKRILSLLLAFLLWAPAAFGWSFGVCGDSRDDLHGVLPRILAAVEHSDMEFLLHTGDLERTGGEAAWHTFRERTKEFPKPLFLVIGNHELYGATREEFARFFGIPGTSYSFTHKDAHFSIVDNASGGLSDSRLAWLDQDLAAHPKGIKGVRYLVVAMHIPPRTDTIFPHGTARNYETQSERLRKILARHKVDLLLSSHEHTHLVEDWEGIKVIVSGGAGAPMFPFQRFGFFRIDLEEGQVREKFLRIREQHGG